MTVPLMILASLFPGGLSALRCESKRVSIAVRGGPPVQRAPQTRRRVQVAQR